MKKSTITDPLSMTLAQQVNEITNPSHTVKDNSHKRARRTKANELCPVDSFIDNCMTFDGSNHGKPVFIPSQLLDKLQTFSTKYNKRLSVRAMVSSLIQTFIDNGGEAAVDEFMKRTNYVPPTEEELEAKRKAAEKARKLRAATKEYLSKQQTKDKE